MSMRSQWWWLLAGRVAYVLGICTQIGLIYLMQRGGAAGYVAALVLILLTFIPLSRAISAVLDLQPWRWRRCGKTHPMFPGMYCLGPKDHTGSCYPDERRLTCCMHSAQDWYTARDGELGCSECDASRRGQP